MKARWKIWVVLAALVLALTVVIRKMSLASEKINVDYSDFADAASLAYQIPARRIKAMIYQESAGNSLAVGSSGERGLMQIKPGALADFNKRFNENYSFDDLFDSNINISVGAGYLSILKNSLDGSLDLATQAFNVGLGTVLQDGSRGLLYLSNIKTKELFF